MFNKLNLNLILLKRKGIKYAYIKGSGKRIKFPRLNEDLASLLGLIYGDGYLSERKKAIKKGNWRIGFIDGDPEVIKRFEHLVNKIFDINPTTYIRYGTYFESYFNSRIIYELFNKVFNIPTGEKINRIRLPKQICLNKKFYFSFLRHLYSTDGTFTIYKGYPRVGLDSATLPFIIDIEKLLLKEKFRPRCYTWNRKGGNKLYGIRLNGYAQVKLFYKKIGFVGKKQKLLKGYLLTNNHR